MHSFTFNGVNCREYCKLFVSGGDTFNSPERDIESVSIPGRNGELTIDHGRFNNIKVKYSGWIKDDFKANAALLRSWLGSQKGYKVLSDDYDPEHYRMARFTNGIEFSTFADHIAGTVTVEFDCAPQRFLTSGDTPIEFDGQTATIVNPTEFESYPIISLIGSGSVTISVNGISFTISNIPSSIVINSEICRRYRVQPLNPGTAILPYDELMSGDYPILSPGTNTIQITSGWETLSRIQITPRWWTL